MEVCTPSADAKSSPRRSGLGLLGLDPSALRLFAVNPASHVQSQVPDAVANRARVEEPVAALRSAGDVVTDVGAGERGAVAANAEQVEIRMRESVQPGHRAPTRATRDERVRALL